MMSNQTPTRRRSFDHRTLLSVGLYALWVGLAVVVLATVPSGSIFYRRPGHDMERIGLRALFPEGFAFFTKSPREPHLRIFSFSDGRWRPAIHRNADPGNAFGIAKDSRIRAMELAATASLLPDSAWAPCRSAPDSWPEDFVGEPYAAVSQAARPNLCGRYVIQLIQPLPWTWLGMDVPISAESRVAFVDIACRDASRVERSAGR